jgi:hypothetical protein
VSTGAETGVLGVVSEYPGPRWVQSARRAREPSVAGGSSPARFPTRPGPQHCPDPKTQLAQGIQTRAPSWANRMPPTPLAMRQPAATRLCAVDRWADSHRRSRRPSRRRGHKVSTWIANPSAASAQSHLVSRASTGNALAKLDALALGNAE